MTVAVLSQVMSGWTGVLTVNGVAITPRRRESVASIWCRAARDVRAQTSLLLTLDPWAIFVAGSAVFSWSSTGNIYSRSGFAAASHSGAAAYTADSQFAGWLAGRYGAHVSPEMRTVRGAVVGTGASAPAPWLTSSKPTIQIRWRAAAPSFSEASENDANVILAGLGSGENVYDVWHGERVVERCRISGVTRRCETRNRHATTNVMSVELETQAVIE